eukprot:scaffold32279_cov80-Skeletonema_marinoi.AAC.1
MPLLFKLPLLLETEKEGLLDVDVEGDVLGKIVSFTEGVDDGYGEVGTLPHCFDGDCVCEGRVVICLMGLLGDLDDGLSDGWAEGPSDIDGVILG